ncbi:MAG TPA: aromatic ring-hydroxylating dioxygenase subunit alpha [Candidatus Sulfotelmatobacter sp.]|nr:aromatic ring-hydroxylating dioxygenase subunit alpha [Candidatus Sulfotelmatobacter sp.]
MLSEETNRLVTEIGPGTKMGALLRRYWHPIAAVAELDDTPVKPMRLFGEDLVLYRDLSGTYGLVGRHCPHRRADLSYGIVESCGLRCHYHGWRFDETGRCREQPFEDTVNPDLRFRDDVRLTAYQVEAKAGLLWAYMGPAPAPLVPTWEPFTWENGFVQIVLSEVPCNWFQCQENSIDPIHFEWMHDNWGARLRGGNGANAPKHLKVDFEEFDWGIVYRRVREGGDEKHPLWTVGRVCLWPNALFTGNHFEWRVPIDDTKTLSVTWFFSRVPKEREPFVQTRIPYWWSPVTDPQTGRFLTSHIMQQDFVAWVGQGVIADRTKEHLGRSDRGVVMLRKRFLSDLDIVAAGGDPKAIVRDPAVNRRIDLPVIDRAILTEGQPADALKMYQAGRVKTYGDIFPHLAGQPDAVRRAFEAAMGFSVS